MPSNSLPLPNSHYISLETAITMTTLFRTNREAMLDPAYQGKNVLALSETFHRDAIETLLNLPDCEAIRIYQGQDENDQVHAILVGVNSSNEDILAVNLRSEDDEPVIVEVGQRCPPTCPPVSPLNP